MATFLLHPARALMARLGYARKILVVVVVMAVPLGCALTTYGQAQHAQIQFSAHERDGVTYLEPLSGLTQQVVLARRAR